MSNPIPLTPAEAIQRILEILREGEVQPTWHCRQERMPQRGVVMADVLHVLQYGQIRRAAEWDEHYGDWKYRVEGEDIEGDELTAVTVIISAAMRLVIVTVF